MDKSVETPVGAIALDGHLAEEAGYCDNSTSKSISRKKKNTRKPRHGESKKNKKAVTIISTIISELL